jgi:hypothetical protein
MRQIMIALHQYSDANGKFPAGCDENNFSALAYALPYLEQASLAESIDMTRSVDDDANATARATKVKTFVSPRDPRSFVDEKFAATSYVLNAGTKYDMTEELEKSDGMFLYKHKLTFDDIPDGTSNTIGLVETLLGDGGAKAVDVKRQYVKLDKKALAKVDENTGLQDFKDNKNIAGDRCASWMDGRFLQTTFNGGRMPNDERPDVRCGDYGGLSGPRSLDDYILTGFMDGSVRTIDSKKIKKAGWHAALTRNAGDVLDF